MGASRRVLRWLRFGYPLRFQRGVILNQSQPPLRLQAPQYLITSYQESVKQQALSGLIQELLVKKCITPMAPEERGHFSRVFLVPKSNGGYRLVIDLSELNKLLVEVTFQMDTLKRIKNVLQPGMWATSIDLSDAYHHIPIHTASQKYLCFQVGNKRYRYLVVPFGLNSGPWVFTETVKQLKRWAIKQGLSLFQYLDDWLNVSLSRDRLCQLTQLLLQMCRNLGLIVNTDKSELIPTQEIIFLGERLDLLHAIAYTSPEREVKIRLGIERVLAQTSPTLTQAESLLGLLTATYPTVPLGRLHLRRFQWRVIKQIRRGRDHKKRVRVDAITRAHLGWWADPQHLASGLPFRAPPQS